MRCFSSIWIILLIFMLPVQPSIAQGEISFARKQAFTGDYKMTQLRTVLAKMREIAKSTRDLSDLQDLGMPESEIKRLEVAMELKIKQLSKEALLLIRAL